jgi:hypothetical protein
MTWEFLHRWQMPFAWLALSSLISVPMAVYLQRDMPMLTGADLGLPYGDSWVLRDDFLATIVVYLLNLGCTVWLFNASGTTRWAAFWCTLMALGRIVGPIGLTSMSGATLAGGQNYLDWSTVRILVWTMDIQMFLLGLMVWGAFSRIAGERTFAGHFAAAHE